ncbi:histidine phosphatase family protein [Lichenihabitans sp. Uapishka_5]|uniref:histidine phosphatase family protein n=1 Tax=Lichenihabitans sp. Uapishka_5 TaxID=3037302 RepID=UPI0029E7EDD0|nr:histidine phosphatase family protein [Lichenihabitans sp. Uapishka_5]
MRHGETDWNREGRLQGGRDVPLNAVGRDQASGAGRILKAVLAEQGRRPDALRYQASPLGRTRDTMERVRDALGLDPSGYDTDARLREIGFGDWEGRTWGELKATVRPLVKERQRNKWSFVPPGGESYAGLAQRLRPWLDGLQTGDVVVGHGGVCRALLHLLAGKAAAEAPNSEIVQGRVLWFRRGRAEWF